MDLSSSDHDRHYEDVDRSIDLISHGLQHQIDLQAPANDEDLKNRENEEHDHEDDDDDVDDDDFTFMLIGHDDGQSYDDEVFEDGRIQPAFPLFDQNLLLDGEYEIEEVDRLPVLPPVEKIFVESPRGFPSSKHEENEDAVTGPYCAWSKDSANATVTATTEMSKKSNSTGFSKLWRLKEKVGRSNSDGRDTFVFLKHSDKSTNRTTTTTMETTTATTATTSSSSSSSKTVTGDGTFVKVNVAGGTARVVKKGKRATVSAHEAYLRSRGGHTEEERRRSYLPYRPELMGLFTNVHGGLTKNVHPY